MKVPEANPLEFSLDEAVDGMMAWRVGPIRAWLEQRLTPSHPDCVRDLATLEATTWWNADGADDVTAATTRLVRAARRSPGSLAPLLLFVRFASMLAWEQEWEVDGIRGVAETLGALVDDEDRVDPEVGHALALMDLIIIPPPGSTVPEELPAEPTRSVLERYAIPHLPSRLAEPLRQACGSPTLRTRPLG